MQKYFWLASILLLASCAAPATRAPTPTLTAAPSPQPNAPNDATICAATYSPPSATEFRSDDPAKLTATAKPKLVEFFAYW
ncbi:MAG: hypothetical protein HY327_10670 [Chloroflexi bacterium]|nr:hypothetical protein [Chloroflexota bacterium]